MNCAEFVAVYPREPANLARTEDPESIVSANKWSRAYGFVLHDALTTECKEKVEEPPLPNRSGYGAWAQETLPAINSTIARIAPTEPEAAAFLVNTTNFHALNLAFYGMWHPFFNGGWHSEHHRQEALSWATDGLAYVGMRNYILRETLASIGKDYVYFSEGMTPFRTAHEGIMQEYDAGLLLINFMRKNPNLTVVPAPMQFAQHHPETNANYVVVDMANGQAVGVQIKSSVQTADTRKYDPSRIVLIDGRVDLDNVRLMRTQPGSSKRRIVNWPGILCANAAKDIQTNGRKTTGLVQATNRTELLRLKHMAKKLALPTNHNQIQARVNARIGAKLCEGAAI